MGRKYTRKAIVQKKQIREFLKLIKDYLVLYEYKPARVLDIGGAEGLLGMALKNAYPLAYVLNIDKDCELIKEGLENFDQIEHLCIDFFELDIPSVFDLIVSSNTFHWFGKRWEEGVGRVYELLDEGGWFFLHQGGRWTYYFLYSLAEECYKELTGETLKHTQILYYPTLKEFREKLSKYFSVVSAFSKIELSDSYSLEELLNSFSVAGARVFTDRLSEEKKEEFHSLLTKKALEEDVPVFGRRLFGVLRKRMKVYVREGSVEEIEDILRRNEGEFVPPLSQRSQAGGQIGEVKRDKVSGIEEYLNSLRGGRILVAINKDGERVGFLAYRKQMLHFTPFPVAYITTIIVDKPYRRLGVGTALYQEVLRREKEVYTRTWSTNKEHLELLKKLNFRQVYIIKDDRGKGIDSIYFKYTGDVS